jgi:hypothetical protein
LGIAQEMALAKIQGFNPMEIQSEIPGTAESKVNHNEKNC